MGMLEAREGEPEVIEPVRQRFARDHETERGHVGEVRQSHPSRWMLLAEHHVAARAVKRPPVGDAALQGAAHAGDDLGIPRWSRTWRNIGSSCPASRSFATWQTAARALWATLRRAPSWAKYAETHARRAYGSATAAEAATARAILVQLRSGYLKPEFSSRDVWRPGWSKLTDREAVRAGLRMLVDNDYLSETNVQTLGRTATVYAVNPKAMKTYI
jgi:hypothetical protein